MNILPKLMTSGTRRADDVEVHESEHPWNPHAQTAPIPETRNERDEVGRVSRPGRTPSRRVPEASQSFPKTMAPLAHAKRRHAGQRRQADGPPFILYELDVCCLLYDTGAPDDVIAAGVLDDTIEKTDANAAGLRTRFGLTIATLEALMVFAADEISKARELSLEREQTRESRLPLVTQLRTHSRTLPVSVIARRTSWRRTSRPR